MLEKSMGLFFFLKKPKNYRGNEPKDVYLKVTIDSIPKEFSCGRKWLASRWSVKAGRALGSKEDALVLNTYLDTIQNLAYSAKQMLIDRGKVITARAIVDLIKGKDEHERKLLVLFQKHNDEMKALIGKEAARGTWVNFRTSLNHTRAFIKFKYEAEDLNILSLDMDFVKDFYNWLRVKKNCCRNTSLKNIANMKKITNDCVDRGWLKVDPFAKFDMGRDEVDATYLTMRELDLILNKDIQNERLSRVRDVFIFCCYTGLAFIDVSLLKRSEVVTGFDGKYWIAKRRKKAGVLSQIPLLPVCIELLKKYTNDENCIAKDLLLPVISNAKYNVYLKEIAVICNINKELTSHVARHTFGTAVTLSNGVPIMSVKNMLGHKKLDQTLHYAKVLPEKLSEDMEILSARLQGKSKGITADTLN